MNPTQTTKSDQIRQLWNAGYPVKQIYKMVGVRHQHAYNVVKAYLEAQEKVAASSVAE